MYYCRVVYVLLYIPMKTEGGRGVHGPPGPPLNLPLVVGWRDGRGGGYCMVGRESG